MKAVKIFGLAALGALLAMAFVGASSAMAESTSLCLADEAPCEEENITTHVHETTLTGQKALLLSSSLEVECDVLFLGDTLDLESAPLIIHGSFTYTNCSNSCTATEENSPTEIQVLRTGAELATVTSGSGAGAGLVHLNCFGFIQCRYVGTGLSGHGLGLLTSSEANGSVTISEQTVSRESGILCPSTSRLDITTTPLEATFIGPPVDTVMVCIELTDSGEKGLYLSGGNGTTCGGQPDPSQAGKFELAMAVPGTGRNEMTCAIPTAPHRGRYLNLNNGKNCLQSDGLPAKGLFELGKTT